jgi:hypothetical protein
MPVQYTSYGRPRADLREAIMEMNPAQGFVTTQVLPVLPVRLKSAAISVLKRENYKLPTVAMNDGDSYGRISLYAKDSTYTTKKFGLEAPVTQSDREVLGNDFEVEMSVATLIENLLRLQQEARTAALLFNTSTWTGTPLYTDVSSAPWDAAASDAIAHVLAAKEKVRINTGFNPDSLLIGAVTMKNLLGNTGIKARFPAAAVLTEEMIRANIAAIFGLQNLYVGNAVYDSAKEGQVFVGADIWSDDYALVFKKNEGFPASGGLGRTVVWESLTPAEGVMVDQYVEKQTKSDILRVEHWTEEKVFDPYFGHLLKVDA